MIPSYPKIFALGTDYVKDIFKENVILEEKLDGSQFSAGKINGELHFRSKRKPQYVDNPDKMFVPVIEHFLKVQDRLPEGMIFYGETLTKPKHNTLKYDRIPKNHMMLFGICDASATSFKASEEDFQYWAEELEVDPPQRLFQGRIESSEQVLEYLEKESYLGGPKIEGVAIKNYSRPFLLGGQPLPFMAAKFVSEAFKEVHQNSWKQEKTGKGRWQEFLEAHRTSARWDKAIQHLREAGELENSPRDIGKLIKEIQRDIVEEEEDNIRDFLWRQFSGELLRYAIRGFPEYFKQKLAERTFESETDEV